MLISVIWRCKFLVKPAFVFIFVDSQQLYYLLKLWITPMERCEVQTSHIITVQLSTSLITIQHQWQCGAMDGPWLTFHLCFNYSSVLCLVLVIWKSQEAICSVIITYKSIFMNSIQTESTESMLTLLIIPLTIIASSWAEIRSNLDKK